MVAVERTVNSGFHLKVSLVQMLLYLGESNLLGHNVVYLDKISLYVNTK